MKTLLDHRLAFSIPVTGGHPGSGMLDGIRSPGSQDETSGLPLRTRLTKARSAFRAASRGLSPCWIIVAIHLAIPIRIMDSPIPVMDMAAPLLSA
jgi:hypothetical protein